MILTVIYLLGVIVNAYFILFPQLKDIRFWKDLNSPVGSDGFKKAIKTVVIAVILTLLSWVGTVLGVIYFMMAVNAGT